MEFDYVYLEEEAFWHSKFMLHVKHVLVAFVVATFYLPAWVLFIDEIC